MINKHLKKMLTFYKKYLNMSLLLLLLFVSLFIILQVCTLWVSERGFIDRLNAKHNSTSKPDTIILRYQYSIDINRLYDNTSTRMKLYHKFLLSILHRHTYCEIITKLGSENYSARLQMRLLSWTINRTFVIRRLLYSSL